MGRVKGQWEGRGILLAFIEPVPITVLGDYIVLFHPFACHGADTLGGSEQLLFNGKRCQDTTS